MGSLDSSLKQYMIKMKFLLFLGLLSVSALAKEIPYARAASALAKQLGYSQDFDLLEELNPKDACQACQTIKKVMDNLKSLNMNSHDALKVLMQICQANGVLFDGMKESKIGCSVWLLSYAMPHAMGINNDLEPKAYCIASNSCK